ncbi:MAG: type II secretion system F family protein [Gammaproteobacteria bacterium]|nr:type II secretion system F family protein [Gammaproteobacteria bacterium]
MLAALSVTTFLSVAALSLALGGLIAGLLRDDAASGTGSGSGPFERLTQSIAQWNRRRDWLGGLMAHLDRRLVLAGMPLGVGAGAEFLALLQIGGVMLSAIFAGLLLLAGIGLATAVGTGVFVGVMGVSLSLAWLENLVESRARALSRQYPAFLDLAVMTMEAGLTFQEAVDAYVRDTKPEALREELQSTLHDLGLGLSEEQALLQLAAGIGAVEVRDSIHSITQGLRSGTPLARLLRDQAEGLRFRRSQLAERIAEELKIRLMGPAILMMAAVIVLILGPVLVNITDSGIFG